MSDDTDKFFLFILCIVVLTFVQSMFSSIDMTPSTPEIKPIFQNLKSASKHDMLIG